MEDSPISIKEIPEHIIEICLHFCRLPKITYSHVNTTRDTFSFPLEVDPWKMRLATYAALSVYQHK